MANSKVQEILMYKKFIINDFCFTDWCEVNISDEQKKFVINLEKCRQKVINVKGLLPKRPRT